MSRSSRSGSQNIRSLFSFNDIEKPVQVHLKNVYSTLSIGLIVACIAAYIFAISSYLQSIVTGLMFLSFLTSIISTLYITFTRHSEETINSRLGAFFVLAFSTGLGLGPLIRLVAVINPDTIPTALLGSALVFASFTLASLLTRKRYYLFLGAALMSAIAMMTTFSFMNIFIQSSAIYQAELYMGFVIFCGFVVFDTQMIVEKRKSGDTDFIWHTLDLFVDFVELFRHLLIILNSKRNRRDDDE